MLAGFARQFNPLSLPKAGYRIGLTTLLLVAGAGSVEVRGPVGRAADGEGGGEDGFVGHGGPP